MSASAGDPDRASTDPTSEPYASSHPSRFRFKSTSRRRRRAGNDSLDDGTHHSTRHTRSHRSHSPTSTRPHRRRHHHRSHQPTTPAPPVDDRSPYDDQYNLPPDVAFRESLFDALADDEGAAYWEGVYGQPIHIYPSHQSTGPQGELEQMSEEEYASFVRGKMWEKSHQHIIEERARREEERKRRKERDRMRDVEGQKWEREVEGSLQRGRERREKGKWRERWESYTAAWAVLGSEKGGTRIPWPTASAKLSEGDVDEVERFFREVARHLEMELAAMLKMERVRWHPDKMQQRLGSVEGEGEEGKRLADRERLMKKVTAVFQVVDRMWNAEREKGKGK